MKIRVELEIECRAYTASEMAEEARLCSMSVADMGGVESDDELDAYEIGTCIANTFYADMDQEMFAGSGVFAKLGDATLIRAEMVPA